MLNILCVTLFIMSIYTVREQRSCNMDRADLYRSFNSRFWCRTDTGELPPASWAL